MRGRRECVKSAIRPARITWSKRAPGPLPRIVFLAGEQEHVITEEDQRVGAGTGAGDMTVVVHVPGRDQRRHLTGDQGALFSQAQLGAAVWVADRVPALMGLHPADRGHGDPAPVGVGVAHHGVRPVDEH